MTLIEIREKFVKTSGRNDLVVDTVNYVDNGVDYYINAGQRMLDMKYRFPKDIGMYPSTLAINGYSILVPFCRSIKEVWVGDGTKRWQLKKKSLQDFLATYTGLLTATEPGSVECYCPAMLRIIPEDAAPSAITTGYIAAITGTTYEYNGILIGPPTDTSLYTEVYGLFYTNNLTLDTDESYWSIVHPELLVRAALYQHSLDIRDDSSARSWLGAIELQTTGIDMDIVEEESSECDQMEG